MSTMQVSAESGGGVLNSDGTTSKPFGQAPPRHVPFGGAAPGPPGPPPPPNGIHMPPFARVPFGSAHVPVAGPTSAPAPVPNPHNRPGLVPNANTTRTPFGANIPFGRHPTSYSQNPVPGPVTTSASNPAAFVPAPTPFSGRSSSLEPVPQRLTTADRSSVMPQKPREFGAAPQAHHRVSSSSNVKPFAAQANSKAAPFVSVPSVSPVRSKPQTKAKASVSKAKLVDIRVEFEKLTRLKSELKSVSFCFIYILKSVPLSSYLI